ncbi:MAG: galactose-1-phosphate uridylyltransferase [Pseudomonadales bacterium]
MIWERRWHPLLEEWITITSHRNQRPWSGSVIEDADIEIPAYLDDCFLCPGNDRVSGKRNDQYESTYVFDNDHPSYGLEHRPELEGSLDSDGFFKQKSARGSCRVLCYSPRHDLTLAEMSVGHVVDVVNIWAEQTRIMLLEPETRNVFIFENKGKVVGVSNPHPHCQIYATDFLFKTIERELNASVKYNIKNGSSLFDDLLLAEEEDGRRIIVQNDDCLAFIPYFARYPYETFIMPKSRVCSISDLDDDALIALAETLHEVLVRFDNLWRCSFPYILALHQVPHDAEGSTDYRFHIQLHPPLRQPGLQKFLAGAEAGGGNFLNDGAPEDKAAELKALNRTHYKYE